MVKSLRMGHNSSHTVQSKASSTIFAQLQRFFPSPLYLMKRADPLRPIKDSPKTFSLSSALCSEEEADSGMRWFEFYRCIFMKEVKGN